MIAIIGRGLLGLTLTVLFVSCRGHHRPIGPTPVARPAEAPPRRVINPEVYAADGMCSDRLVRQHARMLNLHDRILDTLETRLHDFKTARARIRHSIYSPNRVREKMAAERLKQSFAFWLDVRKPYDHRYGEYVCLRREDLRPLSSAEFARGMDAIADTVRHLGPLPPAQNFELGD